MQLDFSKNYFELFDLPITYHINVGDLELAYRDVQSVVHPDRYAVAEEAAQRLAAQWATRANEAYAILKSPLKRARYFLQLHGIDTQEHTHTDMPAAFLMQQIEWREAAQQAGQAKDIVALERIASLRRQAERQLFLQLARELDSPDTYQDARQSVRKLRFLERLGEEIGDAFDNLVE
ncbi:MAG: Fe-S protein assembly co-chaperone HscB [Betaproteobacteria bacterium]|nr:Fe-S protein assembly co-chaperone HscB [Betaproteobacteria bacterium]